MTLRTLFLLRWLGWVAHRLFLIWIELIAWTCIGVAALFIVCTVIDFLLTQRPGFIVAAGALLMLSFVFNLLTD